MPEAESKFSNKQIAAYLARVERELWPPMIRVLHRSEEFGLRVERRPQDYPPGVDPSMVTDRHQRTWASVTSHCREVTARVDMILRILGVSDSIRLDADAGAGAHDLSKAKEISTRPEQGVTWEHYEEINAQADRILRERGIDEKVIWYANAAGHSSLPEAKRLLAQSVYDDETIAWFVIHAVDDWTPGSGWSQEGAFEARMQKSITNPQIKPLAEAGHVRLGDDTFTVQRDVGRRILDILAQIVSQRTGDDVTRETLPTYIDARIAGEIAGLQG